MKRVGIIGTRKRNTITDYNIVKDAFFEIYEKADGFEKAIIFIKCRYMDTLVFKQNYKEEEKNN